MNRIYYFYEGIGMSSSKACYTAAYLNGNRSPLYNRITTPALGCQRQLPIESFTEQERRKSIKIQQRFIDFGSLAVPTLDFLDFNVSQPHKIDNNYIGKLLMAPAAITSTSPLTSNSTIMAHSTSLASAASGKVAPKHCKYIQGLQRAYRFDCWHIRRCVSKL